MSRSRGPKPNNLNFQPKKAGAPQEPLQPLPLDAPERCAEEVQIIWCRSIKEGVTKHLSIHDTIPFANLCEAVANYEAVMAEWKAKHNQEFAFETENSAGRLTCMASPYPTIVMRLRAEILRHCQALGLTPVNRKYAMADGLIKSEGEHLDIDGPTPANEGDGDFSDIERPASSKPPPTCQ